MTKDCVEKRPRGRPPAGAVLIDGSWQLTEQSQQIAAKRVLRARENNRARYREMRELLLHSHPELFVARADLKQTTLPSKERHGDLMRWAEASTARAAERHASFACAAERLVGALGR